MTSTLPYCTRSYLGTRSSIGGTGARVAYNEPYLAVRMRSTALAKAVEAPGLVSYSWKARSRWQQLAATASGSATLRSPVSEKSFITEHYWGYTRQRDGGTVEYEVSHPRLLAQ